MPFLPLLANFLSNPWVELLIVGVIVGTILGALLRDRAFGFMGNMLVGIMGAILGGYLWDKLLSKYISFDLGSINIDINQVVVALLGAFLFLFVIRYIKRKQSD
tara:strand:+ start:1056 stop:1367 length:312 start_codon:yes stop_codon:yes gene_type:complete